MRKAAILAICSVALLVSGCNTLRGMGRDVQAAGQGVENCANGRC